MPNWTFNTITINGSKEDINKMLNDAVKNGEEKLTFSSWFPIPETFRKYDTTNHPNGRGLTLGEKVSHWEENSPIVTEELLAEYRRATNEQRDLYGVVGWYDYNCKFFGCKWDCEVEVCERNSDSLWLSSETPWSDPDKFLLRLSERYPTLSIHNHASFEEGYWEDNSYYNGRETEEDSGEERWDDED